MHDIFRHDILMMCRLLIHYQVAREWLPCWYANCRNISSKHPGVTIKDVACRVAMFVSAWRHGTISSLLALYEGIPQSPVDSPYNVSLMRDVYVFHIADLNTLFEWESRCQRFERPWRLFDVTVTDHRLKRFDNTFCNFKIPYVHRLFSSVCTSLYPLIKSHIDMVRLNTTQCQKQQCNDIANARKLLQSCSKPSL